VSAADFAVFSRRPAQAEMIRGESAYGCAPHFFYYARAAHWYLIFQTRDSDYQPAFLHT
jgi:hypothetical protein